MSIITLTMQWRDYQAHIRCDVPGNFKYEIFQPDSNGSFNSGEGVSLDRLVEKIANLIDRDIEIKELRRIDSAFNKCFVAMGMSLPNNYNYIRSSIKNYIDDNFESDEWTDADVVAAFHIWIENVAPYKD